MALLSDMSGAEPAQIVDALADRVHSDDSLTEEEKKLVFASAYILAGLRYDALIVNSLFGGINNMEESSTYQYILTRGLEKGLEQGLEQGRTKGVQDSILRIGGRRFGRPNAAIITAIASIVSLTRLEQLEDRLLEVETWDELLTA